jgi:hypothetical protein
MLTDLPDDIKRVLIQHLDNISLVMLCHVDKKYHKLVSSYGRINDMDRRLDCYKIAQEGYLEILKWAKENEYDWFMFMCSTAAHYGHLEILKWARENGCYWDSTTYDSAAYNGNLEVFKWARKNGCVLGPNTFFTAFYQGNLEILKWARENDCPWDSDTELIAKQNWPETFK